MSLLKQGSAQSHNPTDGGDAAELDFEQTWDRYINALEDMRNAARERQSKLTEMIDAARKARGRPKLLEC
ncbi:MAG TPA: hypothetical protein VN734_17230 [Acidobacteriaceae bacterium]|nr:hypothetical protein [Acidobacteriaceae bacterium]